MFQASPSNGLNTAAEEWPEDKGEGEEGEDEDDPLLASIAYQEKRIPMLLTGQPKRLRRCNLCHVEVKDAKRHVLARHIDMGIFT